MSIAPKNACALCLELLALRISARMGSVPELCALSCAEIAALMRRVRENRPDRRPHEF